ncbi:MAG TPA: hypothetical protein VLI90_04675 [Tepidisphaeraceae bacterium]|nr:hypothetical protein [Tepidisphaeraceae bacterium]
MSESPVIVFPAAGAQRFRAWAIIVAAAWIVCVIIGWIFEPDVFYRSYLFAWLFWLGVTLGAIGVVMLHHLMGGHWGTPTRRLGEHAGMTLPLMIVLFIPVAIGLHSLFIWSRADELAKDPTLRHKAAYLNVPFFLLRACFYFASWLLLAWYLRSRSLRFERTRNPATERAMHNVSAGGMLYYFISMSFAGVDWIMSREPHWFSTVFGLLVVAAQGISGLCFIILVLSILYRIGILRGVVDEDQFNDLGSLLLTFVIVWAYLAFVQLLVIWMGNKQDEIPWYVQRLSNGWWWIGLLLVLLHFLVPFIVLLMRQLKRSARAMLWLCAGLLIMRAVDVFWMVGPSGDDPQPLLRHILSWLDFVLPIGMGGAWLLMFLWLADGSPLLVSMPTGAPAAERADGLQGA